MIEEQGNPEEVKRKRPRKAKDEPKEEIFDKVVRADEQAPIKEQENKRLHKVLIKGKERYLTDSNIAVVSRDPSLELKIPADSTYKAVGEIKTKKCKDC